MHGLALVSMCLYALVRVSQTCLGANVPSGLVPSTFFRNVLGHSRGLVYGEGGTPGTVHLHNLRVTSHVLHQDVPLKWYQILFFFLFFEIFLGILRGPGEGGGGTPGMVPLQNPQATSPKACLRNADLVCLFPCQLACVLACTRTGMCASIHLYLGVRPEISCDSKTIKSVNVSVSLMEIDSKSNEECKRNLRSVGEIPKGAHPRSEEERYRFLYNPQIGSQNHF